MEQNNLICGDCKDWLPFIPDNSVDLIYIDPPFFSNKNYAVIWGNGHELRSFEDRWLGGVQHYIGWMRPKIIEARKKLKNQGVILLHCDWHANHHLRVLLDELFGEKNFVNEIIWHYKTGGSSKKFLSRKHDTIYLYSKTKNYTYNLQKEKRYTKAKGRKAGVINYGQGMAEFFEDGNGVYNLANLSDVWEIPYINSMSKERVGYRTQKPEELIKRAVVCFSNKNDTVLDFFGGG